MALFGTVPGGPHNTKTPACYPKLFCTLAVFTILLLQKAHAQNGRSTEKQLAQLRTTKLAILQFEPITVPLPFAGVSVLRQMLLAAVPERGVYYSFVDFCNNKPVADSFMLVKGTLTDELFVHRNWQAKMEEKARGLLLRAKDFFQDRVQLL